MCVSEPVKRYGPEMTSGNHHRERKGLLGWMDLYNRPDFRLGPSKEVMIKTFVWIEEWNASKIFL